MNNKKAKKIRNIINQAYGEKYSDEFLNTLYKRIKKSYSHLDSMTKGEILKDSEFLISVLKNDV